MITAFNSSAQLLAIAQDLYPVGSILGSLALLDSKQYLFAACTNDPLSDLITLPNACPLLSGWPCYASIPGAGGSLPSGLALGSTYYAIRVTATEIQLASSFANAQAGISIPLGTAGVGMTIAEAPPTIDDPLALVLLHESLLPVRPAVACSGITSSANAATAHLSSTAANSTAGALTVGGQVLIYGGSTVVGVTSDQGFALSRLRPALSIAAGETYKFEYDVEIS